MNDAPDPNAAQLADMLARARQTEEELQRAKQRLGQIETDAAAELKTLIEERTKAQTAANALSTELNKLGKDRDTVNGAAGRVQVLEDNARKAADAAGADAKKIETSRASCDEALKQVQAVNDNIRTQSTDAENELTALLAQIEALKKERDDLKSVLAEFQSAQTAIEKSKEAAQADSQAIATAKTIFEKLKIETDAAHTDLKTRQAQAASKAAEIDAAHTQVTQEFQTLLKDSAVDGMGSKSIATQIRELNDQSKAELADIRAQGAAAKKEHDAFSQSVSTQWESVKQEYDAKQQELLEISRTQIAALKLELEKEIRKLLPGAGAAGLSSAYYDAKLNYGPGKFDYKGLKKESHHNWKKIRAWVAYQIRTLATPLTFYAFFIVPLAIVAYFFYELMEYVMKHPHNFNAEFFLFRVLLALPLATISWFGWSSIRLHRHLYEEYNHKQRVMELYDSFKKEIEKSGTPEQEKALLTVMLATVSDKPSLTMHKYDQPAGSKTEGFSWGTLLDSVINSTKSSTTH